MRITLFFQARFFEYFRHFLIFALLLSASPVNAQFSSLGLGGEEKADAVESAPHPGRMKAKFWQYISQATKENIAARVKGLSESLEPLASNELRKDALKRLNQQLEALPKLRELEAAPQTPPYELAAQYTISQWLAFEQKLKNVETDLEDKRKQSKSLEGAIDDTTQRFNNRLAEYLELVIDSPARIDMGFELITDRAALAVLKQRLRLSRSEAIGAEKVARQLRALDSDVRKRLAATQDDISAAEKQAGDAAVALDKAHTAALEANEGALAALAKEPDAPGADLLAQQRNRYASAKQIDAIFGLAGAQAQLHLMRVLSGEPGTEKNKDYWQTLLSDKRASLDQVAADSQRAEQEASNRIAALEQTEGKPSTLQRFGVVLDVARDTQLVVTRARAAAGKLELLVSELSRRNNENLAGASRAFANVGFAVSGGWDQVSRWMSDTLFTISETPVTALGLLRVFLIVLIAWVLSRIVRSTLARLADSREGVRTSGFYSVGRLAHHAILIIGFIVGLSSIGIDFTNLAIVAGALSVGLGFGLQSVVNNFVSGMILLFERTLKVGDFIELPDGLTGEVKEINVRSTLINTNDNIDIIVPNSELVSNRVTNWTLRQAIKRVRIPFGVAYGSDLEAVDKAALEAAENVSHTLSRGGLLPKVWLVEFGDSSLNFELVVWLKPDAVKRPGSVTAEYNRALAKALEKYNLEIPFPQRDLNIRSVFGEADEEARERYENIVRDKARQDKRDKDAGG